MARPWTQALRGWYQRSSTSELTEVAARRLSAELAAAAARSGIIDAPRAVTGPPASRPGPTPDTTAMSVPVPVFPAHPEVVHTEEARRDSDESVRPTVAPMGVEDAGAEADDPAPPAIPLPLGRPEIYKLHDGNSQETTTAEPGLTGERSGHVDHDEPGRWLPLRDALQEIGSLDRLCQLTKEGKLQSRAEAVGQIEVWVTDRDCFGGTPARRLDATRLPESVVLEGSHCSEVGHQGAALIAALVENHERHLELARENGVLSERVAQLERQLAELAVAPLAG